MSMNQKVFAAGNLTTKVKASGTRTFAWDARGAGQVPIYV